jgi:hypothetical protein
MLKVIADQWRRHLDQPAILLEQGPKQAITQPFDLVAVLGVKLFNQAQHQSILAGIIWTLASPQDRPQGAHTFGLVSPRRLVVQEHRSRGFHLRVILILIVIMCRHQRGAGAPAPGALNLVG